MSYPVGRIASAILIEDLGGYKTTEDRNCKTNLTEERAIATYFTDETNAYEDGQFELGIALDPILLQLRAGPVKNVFGIISISSELLKNKEIKKTIKEHYASRNIVRIYRNQNNEVTLCCKRKSIPTDLKVVRIVEGYFHSHEASIWSNCKIQGFDIKEIGRNVRFIYSTEEDYKNDYNKLVYEILGFKNKSENKEGDSCCIIN